MFGSPYLTSGSDDAQLDRIKNKSDQDPSTEIIEQSESKTPDRIRILCKSRYKYLSNLNKTFFQ